MPSTQDTALLDTVIQFFQEDEWPFDQAQDKPLVRTAFRSDNGSWRCYVNILPERQFVIFYSVLDILVPQERLQAATEFITRANYGLFIGNFELDLSDGEVRFKTSIAVTEEGMSTAMFQQLVYTNVMTMDKYLPGIMRIAFSDVAPAEAIAAIEG